MAERVAPHPISEAIAAEASRYLVVIDHVLALDYLQPDLRRRVVKMQRRLIEAELSAHYPDFGEDEAST